MKYIIMICLGLIPFLDFGQAGGSADFMLKLKFDKEIPVESIEPCYFLKNGNSFDTISYTIDTQANEIILKGRNSYILWISFPTLVFSLKQQKQFAGHKTKSEVSYQFYLVSNGTLVSYTGEQKKIFKFSYEESVLFTDIKLHNESNAHGALTVHGERTYQGHGINMNIGNELVKIYKQ